MNPVTVTKAKLLSNVVTLTVATLDQLRVGYHVTVQGIGQHFDGNHVLTGAITTTVGTVTTYTVTYAQNHANIAEADVDGRITPVCTWISDSDVTDFLGFLPDSEPDIAWLAVCTETANDWCATRRAENDYADLLDHVPSPKVQLGTVLYAAGLFRERGSIDSFSSFQEMPMPSSLAGSMGQINRLLGLMKPRVA